MFYNRGFSIRKHKSVLVIIFIVFFIILFSVLIRLSMTPFRKEEFVPNIYGNHISKPSEGRNIFFHETSGLFKLNARQACAVESAALMNPDLNVFLLFLSENGFPNATTTPLFDAMLKYRNIHINYLNITQYAEGTPMQEWIKKDKLSQSKYQISHTSDVLRFLTLWKYGGTYLDLDVVVLKPVDTFSNYAGVESSEFVGSAIINMSQDGKGHELAEICVRELVEHFDGVEWANNGPALLTRILRKMCNTDDNFEMNIERCRGFQVLPQEYFYAISFPDYAKFFEEGYLKETMEKLKNSIIVHIWNKLSESTKLSVNSTSPYIHMAKQYCPKVIEACGEYF
ncbi:unnamed protein product [Diamesa serratosioi]